MKRDKTTQRVYRCNEIPGVGGCGKISGKADTIEEIVETYARARLEDERVRANLHRINSSPREHAQELTMLEARITELEAQLDEPGVPVATILRAIDRAKERYENLQGALAVQTHVDLPDRGGAWPTDLARRRALIALVVDRVWLDPATSKGVFDPARVRIKDR